MKDGRRDARGAQPSRGTPLSARIGARAGAAGDGLVILVAIVAEGEVVHRSGARREPAGRAVAYMAWATALYTLVMLQSSAEPSAPPADGSAQGGGGSGESIAMSASQQVGVRPGAPAGRPALPPVVRTPGRPDVGTSGHPDVRTFGRWGV